MAGLGVEKLEKLMPEIVATASKVDIAPHVRDGYIMMFNYLPITFGDKFTPYVGPIIPCILKVGTSDRAQEGGRGRIRFRINPPGHEEDFPPQFLLKMVTVRVQVRKDRGKNKQTGSRSSQERRNSEFRRSWNTPVSSL